MKNIVKKTILDVKPYIPGKPIDEVKREFGLKDVIKLASNENPYGPSPSVLAAVRKALPTLNRYPDGNCFYLRQEIAKRLKISSSQLIFGNGSDELIVLAVRAFIKEGDDVVLAQPSFLVYDIAARIEGANIRAVPLKGFRYDLTGMKNAVTEKTKIIFLGNPDNPAGSYFTKKDIVDFVSSVRPGILIFIDEAYYEYVNAKDYVDSISLLKSYKNIFITRTFSKMYGLAGLRVGYGVGDEELISLLNRIREPFNVNSLAQVAALACLKDQAYYKKIAKEFNQQKQAIYKGLKKLNVKYVESCTNFILIDVGSKATEVSRNLLKKGMIVRDMSPWGLKQYIRVTIGTPKENAKFMNSLEEVL